MAKETTAEIRSGTILDPRQTALNDISALIVMLGPDDNPDRFNAMGVRIQRGHLIIPSLYNTGTYTPKEIKGVQRRIFTLEEAINAYQTSWNAQTGKPLPDTVIQSVRESFDQPPIRIVYMRS